MKKFNILAAGLLTAIATPAAADSVFTANLNGQNEVPPILSRGTGTATVTIDESLATMRVQESFSGLSAPATASHIHCCSATAAKVNLGVATTVPTFTDFPAGVTAGTYDHTFNMLDASSYNPAFISGHGGTANSAASPTGVSRFIHR